MAGKGEEAERSWEPAGIGVWGRVHRTRRYSEIRTGRWWGSVRRGLSWGAGIQEGRGSNQLCVYGVWRVLREGLWVPWEKQKEDSGEVAMGTGGGTNGERSLGKGFRRGYTPLSSRAEQGSPCVCVSV